jgi:hypothetical protein
MFVGSYAITPLHPSRLRHVIPTKKFSFISKITPPPPPPTKYSRQNLLPELVEIVFDPTKVSYFDPGQVSYLMIAFTWCFQLQNKQI